MHCIWRLLGVCAFPFVALTTSAGTTFIQPYVWRDECVHFVPCLHSFVQQRCEVLARSYFTESLIMLVVVQVACVFESVFTVNLGLVVY